MSVGLGAGVGLCSGDGVVLIDVVISVDMSVLIVIVPGLKTVMSRSGDPDRRYVLATRKILSHGDTKGNQTEHSTFVFCWGKIFSCGYFLSMTCYIRREPLFARCPESVFHFSIVWRGRF